MATIPLDFHGLTAQFPRLEDVLTAVVYGSRQGLNGVAARLDQSPSELSRRLNRESDDHRPVRVQDLVGIIEATSDMRPICWLIEKFMESPEARVARAADQLAHLLPMVTELAVQAGIATGKARK
jgi:hypothetical protein